MNARWILGLSLLAATSVSRVSADSVAFRDQVLKTDGLVGYWPFENSFQDLSPNANAAKPHPDNSPAITFVPGVNGGQAMHINNATMDQWVEVPAPIGSVFDQPKFTLFTFVRLASVADEGNWNDLFNRNSLWYLEVQSRMVNGELLGQLIVRIYDPANPTSNGSGQVRDDAGLAYVKKNEWHQYAMTYDGKFVAAYLDGNLVLLSTYSGGVGPTAATPTTPPSNNYNMTWGAWDQSDDWFTGDVDDTAYFKRALTADEIKGLYDAMMAPVAKP